MSGLEIKIELENVREIEAILNRFPIEFKNGLYTGLQRIANTEEKVLKSTGGFQDRTGRSRRSLFVVATWNPLGLEMGSFLQHMGWLAGGHGTWLGNWWEGYKRGMVPRVTERIGELLKRIVKKFNRDYKGE